MLRSAHVPVKMLDVCWKQDAAENRSAKKKVCGVHKSAHLLQCSRAVRFIHRQSSQSRLRARTRRLGPFFFRMFTVERVSQKFHHLGVFSVLVSELPQRSWKVRIRVVLVQCRGGLSAFDNRKSLPDALLLDQCVHAFHDWEGLSPGLSHCDFDRQLYPC